MSFKQGDETPDQVELIEYLGHYLSSNDNNTTAPEESQGKVDRNPNV
jgi:hypothetical protein